MPYVAMVIAVTLIGIFVSRVGDRYKAEGAEPPVAEPDSANHAAAIDETPVHSKLDDATDVNQNAKLAELESQIARLKEEARSAFARNLSVMEDQAPHNESTSETLSPEDKMLKEDAKIEVQAKLLEETSISERPTSC